jgi:hypothetical protein
MGWLYLGHDGSFRTALAECRSGYGYEDMGWLYLGQDRDVIIWAVCILSG